MSGSEQRIRNYRTSARLDAAEKQRMVDITKALGFQSEGDLIRYFFLGTQPFKRPQVSRKYIFGAFLKVFVQVNDDGTFTRKSDRNF